MSLITREERKYIADNCTFRHNSPAGFKIIDINKAVEYTMKNIEKRGESMIKEIVPLKPHKFKEPYYSFVLAKDKEFGTLFGLYSKDDNAGNPLWQRVGVSDGLTINLKNESDQKIWTVIRMWSKIEGSPYESIDPVFKLYDESSEAEKELSFMNNMQKAVERAYQIVDDPEHILSFLRHMGENVSTAANMKILKAKLLNKARMEPIIFNKAWNDETRVYSETFESAMQSAIMEHHIDEGYKFKDIHLGLSKDEVIVYFKEHEDVFNSIKHNIKESDTVLGNLKKESETNKVKEKTKSEPKTSDKKKDNQIEL